MRTREWIDELITRSEVALAEAERFGSQILIDLGTARLRELRLLREQIPAPREPDE